MKKAEPKIYDLGAAFIVTVLDISTCHVTQKDTELLEQDDCPVTGYPYGPKDDTYGHLVHLNEDAKDFAADMKAAKSYGFSSAFIKICKAAREKHCAYVRFDRDGAMYDLPSFDW
jgi:hypothetical protein